MGTVLDILSSGDLFQEPREMRPYQAVFLSVHMVLYPSWPSALRCPCSCSCQTRGIVSCFKNIAPVDCNSYHFEIKNKIVVVPCTRAANSSQQDPNHAQRGAQENQHENGHPEGAKETLFCNKCSCRTCVTLCCA